MVKIIYEHYRYPKTYSQNGDDDYHPYFIYRYKRNFKPFNPSGKGGMTICCIVLSNGDEYVGYARCNLADNFNYKLGRRIALGRALKAASEDEVDIIL